MATISLISIVDDDECVRESLQGLLRSVGFAVRAFASAEEFLNSGQSRETACVIVDVRMTGMSGLELQRKLTAIGSEIPVIFITAHAEDTEARQQAMGGGAVDYLLKPLTQEVILNAVEVALRSKLGMQGGKFKLARKCKSQVLDGGSCSA